MGSMIRNWFGAMAFAGTLIARAAVTVAPDDARIQYIGRFDAGDAKHPRCDWPASALRARFTGTSLTVKLSGGKNNYNVQVDGKDLPNLVLQDGKDTYPAAAGLAAGEHTLVLSKRTEGSGGISTFGGLVLDDGASLSAPPARPPRRVQILGESYAAGYGAEGTSSSCADRRPFDNADKTFGAVLARALDAELSLQAISCIGLLHNCGDGVTPSKEPFTTFYKRTLNGSVTPPWDAGSWIPDVVVITLANNDLDGSVKPTHDQFVSAYRAFLADLRTKWPQAGYICVAFGYDNQDSTKSIKREYIKEIVDLEKAAGNARTEFLFYGTFPSQKNLQGCNGHPSVATHQKVADALLPLAQRLLPGTAVMPVPSMLPHGAERGGVPGFWHYGIGRWDSRGRWAGAGEMMGGGNPKTWGKE
jgi:hypothetical protein